jgi:CelD/BcsL family acetyltransferase involved in cellulose biosynthesis
VIDAGCIEPVLTAMLDALAAHGSLPKLIMLTDISVDGPVMAGLRRVLDRRGAAPAFLKHTQRPMLRSGLSKEHHERLVSPGTHKKLRQHRRRLAKHGPVAFVTHSRPEEVRDALEEFLRMEASGWKGRHGTALLSDERSAVFARYFVNALASDGLATTEALRVGDRPVAMQVLLRSGNGAFTWKVAYDEALSPRAFSCLKTSRRFWPRTRGIPSSIRAPTATKATWPVSGRTGGPLPIC